MLPFFNYFWSALAGVAMDSRQFLVADTTFYLDATTGNDTTGDGSISAPWQTLNGAWLNVAQQYDCQGFGVKFVLEDGTYAGLSTYTLPQMLGSKWVWIEGSGQDTIIQPAQYFYAVYLDHPEALYVNNLRVSGSAGYYAYGFSAGSGGASVIVGYTPNDTYGDVWITGNFVNLFSAVNSGIVVNYGSISALSNINMNYVAEINSGGIGTIYINAFDCNSYTITISIVVGCFQLSRVEWYLGTVSEGSWTVSTRSYSVNSNSILKYLTAVPGSNPLVETGGQVYAG